ncbi:MAG TPA: phosphoribosylanthranilate isomerase [Isosphaeraceae bacterium]|jgi:phosphoribosylanthranilate isomerase|nr:phosphoribosylanthranilate isomerase [Isosphaeraceae bacterium]
MSTVRIKVCGVTSVADALACASAGTDWIGLNFYPRSPRCIDESLGAAIVEALPATTEAVGLFVNRPPAEVAEIARRVGIRIVQLHGDEPPEDFLALEGLQVVRAFRLADADSIARMEAYLERAAQLGRVPDAVLVDAFAAGQPGGTGQTIADDLLDRLPDLPRLILSGGLTPANVSERIHRVRPWMVDVASGVESTPGRKDARRVQAFIQAAWSPNETKLRDVR